jgi:peptidyl-Lys metalloendopeptidase
VARDRTCDAPAASKEDGSELFPPLAEGCRRLSTATPVADKRTSVASLVQVALADQVRMLQAKAAELERWGPRERAVFFKWFGTADDRSRDMIGNRITILLKINELYSVRNFRRAVPSRPGVFAFVHPTDPSRVFVDVTFVRASRVGENSRAGTITHEMSHFLIAGGTKDHAYGTTPCKALARRNPALALTNADNFEFYVENAP